MAGNRGVKDVNVLRQVVKLVVKLVVKVPVDRSSPRRGEKRRIVRVELFRWWWWPFLVRGVTCLLNCDNERDLTLLNSQANFG